MPGGPPAVKASWLSGAIVLCAIGIWTSYYTKSQSDSVALNVSENTNQRFRPDCISVYASALMSPRLYR
jgi:hypothetical protein